ncbi:hypothetical protein C0992_005554 [Termitomyces sp. T32_za158]|nr:hypothetical protein C0992_005554 [Termitomyces sp. T32_za158]
MAINQQQWQRGSWQFNPAYNWQSYPVPQVQWIAASAWNYPAHHIHQPVPANFNPYKKVIKPPSAEYLAMKVSDNGLDLHNMKPAVNPNDNAENPPETPWIWNPATLTHDAPPESARRAAATAAAAAANDRAQNRSSSEPQSSRSRFNSASAARPRHATDPSSSSSRAFQASSAHNGSSPLKPTFSNKVIRVPSHYAHPSNASASTDSLAYRMEHMSTSGPASLGRQSSMPSIYSDSRQSSSISGAQISDEPMSILSPLIIPMTPKPPRPPVTRGATYPNIGGNLGLDTISEAPVVPLTTSSGSSSRRRETQSEIYPPKSAPASQQSFARPTANRSETYPRFTGSVACQDAPSHDRSLRNVNTQDSRHPSNVQQHTPPDLESSLAPRPTTPRRPIEIYAATPPPPQRSASLDHIPMRHSSLHQSSPTKKTRGTPKHSPAEAPRSPKHTPPTLPQDYPITPVSLHRNTAPASPYTYDEERPKPVKPVRIYTPVSLPPPQRRRLGFWNRRGDHCTNEGYLVFAPPGQAFPDELSTYPERDFQDDLGFRIAFDPKRPELPESLPRHGQPAQKPYKDVRDHLWYMLTTD